MIRVLLVDDHPVTREGTRRILEDASDIQVVGEAGDGKEAIRLAQEISPDILLLDIALPEMDGVKVARIIRDKMPHTQIVVLTGYDSQAYAHALVRLGVRSYLTKTSLAPEILQAIRTVYSGNTYFSPSTIQYIADSAKDNASDKPTAREQEVLELVSKGLRNRDIALSLQTSERTVQFHISNLFAKLGASSRTELLHLARKKGWID